MKYLSTFSLYLITLATLCVIPGFLFDGLTMDLAIIFTFFAWTMTFFYLDRFVLLHLNAREVISTDEQVLFQKVKNEVYKSTSSTPRVYFYTGSSKNCFVLESLRGWSLVIDKMLLKSLGGRELEALIHFLFQFRKLANPSLQTKVMGITAMILVGIHSFVRNSLRLLVAASFISYYFFAREIEMTDSALMGDALFVLILLAPLFIFVLLKFRVKSFLLASDSTPFRVLSLFMISLFRPFLFLLNKLGKKQYRISADLSLEPIFNEQESKSFIFDQFLVEHFNRNLSLKNVLIEYLEGYPVLENCKFEKNEF